MFTDLCRRLNEGADNIHSIGAGRAADLIREAASVLRRMASLPSESLALFAGRAEADRRPGPEACVVISADAPTTVTKTETGWQIEPVASKSDLFGCAVKGREAALNEELAMTRRRLADLQEKVSSLIGVAVPQLHDPCGSGDIISALRASLGRIDDAYRQRNVMVCVAARLLLNGRPASSEWGYVAGIFTDPHAEPGFGTVVALDLAGQVTFHMDERDPAKPWAALPPYHGEWDGHSDAVKWERVKAFLGERQVVPGAVSVQADASLRPYFVGPHLYVAEDEVEARAFHADMVATSSLKLNALREVIAGNDLHAALQVDDAGDRWDASLRIDALMRMLQDAGDLISPGDLDVAVVEFCEDAGWVKVSKKDAEEWCRRGKGNVGVLQSYYETKVKPHLDALLGLAVKIGSEVQQ